MCFVVNNLLDLSRKTEEKQKIMHIYLASAVSYVSSCERQASFCQCGCEIYVKQLYFDVFCRLLVPV